MDREEAFEFLDRTARGIAEMFGSTCETLVHDMGDPSHPILSIYNGHVSGRTVGSTLDILGTAKELDEDALVTDFVNLYATTPSGQQIKSSTFTSSGRIQPGPWHQLRLQLPGVRQPHSGGPHERGGRPSERPVARRGQPSGRCL